MESQREPIPASPAREDSSPDRPIGPLSSALRSSLRALPIPERAPFDRVDAAPSWIESRDVGGTIIAILVDSEGIVVDGRLVREPTPSEPTVQACPHDHELFFTTLLAWLRGTPLQEAAEHGVGTYRHRLEIEPEPTLAGIRHARYPHPYFDRAEALLRDVWSQWRIEHGRAPDHNSSECGLRGPFAWASATAATRLGWVRAALDEVLTQEALPLGQLRVERVDHDWIVYLHLEPGLRVDLAGRLITRVEAVLRRRHDPRVELFLPSWEDRNLLRRRTRQVALDGSR